AGGPGPPAGRCATSRPCRPSTTPPCTPAGCRPTSGSSPATPCSPTPASTGPRRPGASSPPPCAWKPGGDGRGPAGAATRRRHSSSPTWNGLPATWGRGGPRRLAAACAGWCAGRRGNVPRLSVVIPTHNRPDLLRLCLASVTRHAPPDTEVVVADDGSPG